MFRGEIVCALRFPLGVAFGGGCFGRSSRQASREILVEPELPVIAATVLEGSL